MQVKLDASINLLQTCYQNPNQAAEEKTIVHMIKNLEVYGSARFQIENKMQT